MGLLASNAAAEPRVKVVIVGAGIAGLATGMMLREHMDVTILESATEFKEIGAAVSLGTGVVAILRKYGVDLTKYGAMPTNVAAKWAAPTGMMMAVKPWKENVGHLGDVLAVHRADLHSALLHAATTPERSGAPCRIVHGYKVVKLHPEDGVIELEDGTRYVGDIVVGADGNKSATRSFIVPDVPAPRACGDAAYRFLIQLEDLKAINHPLLKDDLIPPTLHMVVGPKRKMVAYPCRNGTALNCVAYLPESALRDEIPVSGAWSLKGETSALVQSFEIYKSPWKDILQIAKNIGLWRLQDMDPLSSWVNGRSIIIGDAAHSMLPYQAAGAMSALEDAEALATCLRDITVGSDPKSINDALQRVFRLRYKRASECQLRSRAVGLGLPPSKTATEDLFDLWTYPGAEKWEVERPDMVLAPLESTNFTGAPSNSELPSNSS